MMKLSCVGCGQRYYGLSGGHRCDFCQSELEETGWHGAGIRAGLPPMPVVQPPLPAYPQSGKPDVFGTPQPLSRAVP